MNNIGDTVVYGSSGVMSIVDITDEVVLGTRRRYYVLCADAGGTMARTFVPLDNEKLTSQMLPLLSKEEALGIIRGMKTYPELTWIEESRARHEHFKSIMESGDRAKILAMIRSIKDAGLRRLEQGKKNYLSDEGLMAKAEKILYRELSIVLGIPEEDIPAFIEEESKK